MKGGPPIRFPAALLLFQLLFLLALPLTRSQERFTVATFNLENYLDAPAGNRPAKSPESKAKVHECLLLLGADVLALQEIGTTNALLELRGTLASNGLEYPHWEHLTGFDTNINLAVLSRFPFRSRRLHAQDSFLLAGRRYRVQRGFLEVDVQVHPHYAFTLFTAHLKSRLPVGYADQADLREEEARLLREKISARLAERADANIIVLGDFNDTKDSPTLRTLLGRGRTALLDTRPAERNGDGLGPSPKLDARKITWTHYYGREDTYSRIDYILLSPGLAREWDPRGTFIPRVPDWGLASDHRPLIASFFAVNK